MSIGLNMKTRELIELLQKEDPDGETEVTINGHAIRYLVKLPGYYDGSYSKLICDEKGYPKEFVLSRIGKKIVIHDVDLDLLLLDWPELKVTVEGFTEEQEKAYFVKVGEMREENRKIREEAKAFVDRIKSEEKANK